MNNQLKSFFESRGILHERTVPYVPQQNGFVERDMRTVKEAAKTILNRSKLDKDLWAEAINCTIYTLNRVINSSNQISTPYEQWFGRKPNLKNLHIFGEVAILKKLDGNNKGFWDKKGTEAVFVGYTERFNTFRFLQGSKVVESCDATFLNKMHDNSVIETIVDEESCWVSDSQFNNLNDDLEQSSPYEPASSHDTGCPKKNDSVLLRP